jgi:glycerol-3-phosphate O-acyltransferase
VLPVPLVASVFMRDPQRSFSDLELKAEVLALIARVESRGGHVYVPRTDRDYALTVGLRMLTLRHLVTERRGLFVANPAELKVLAYYANSIAHLL